MACNHQKAPLTNEPHKLNQKDQLLINTKINRMDIPLVSIIKQARCSPPLRLSRTLCPLRERRAAVRIHRSPHVIRQFIYAIFPVSLAP